MSRPMKNVSLHTELNSALADLDKCRLRLEALRDWSRGELARDNTASARALLERTVPEQLREKAPPSASEAVQAGKVFREVSAILNRGRK